ncbi:MAG: SHOCT domain-containing protein [Tepidibacillus sp.]
MMFGGGHMGGFGGPGFGGYGNGYGYNNGWGYGPGGGYGNGFGYGMMSGWNLTGILFLVLVGFLVYLLIKRSKQHGAFSQPSQPLAPTKATSNEAVEIAKLRYVRGEISYDEYQEIVKVINS